MADQTEPEEPEVVDPGESKKRHVPFLDLLQVQPVSIDGGHARFDLTIEDRHLRTLGILHGGVTAALLDTTMGRAAGTMAPKGYYVVTVQLNVNFIRPAWKGETLVATGEVKHSGQQTAVASGEIRTSDNMLVASGTATFMYLKRPKDETNLEKHSDNTSENEDTSK